MDFFSGMGSSLVNLVGGMRQQNQNSAMAASQRQADERGAERSMDFSSAQAAVQRDFQERMAGTAHQREIEDLRKAGLNPILSGTGGMGSASPAGAAGTGSKAGAALQAPATNLLGDAVNTGLAAAKNKADISNVNMDTELKDKLGKLSSLDWNVRQQDQRLRQEQFHTQQALTEAAQHQASIYGHQARGWKLEGEIDQTKYGEMMRFIDRAVKSLTGGSSAYRNFQQ